MHNTILTGGGCACSLEGGTITISGTYYRYDLHKRWRVSGPVSVDLLDVLRVGMTKTYSRLMFMFPMCFGFAALIIKAIPAAEISYEIIPDVYSVGYTFWSVPFQDMAWKACAALCLLTIPLYWLSYRNDLEINTMKGRFLLPRKGMAPQEITAFQREFTRLKVERRKAVKSV